jgi:hypothetical protein
MLMSDPLPKTDPDGESSGFDAKDAPERMRESAPATPRWVYIFGLITLVVVVVIVVLHLTGYSFGGHMP